MTSTVALLVFVVLVSGTGPRALMRAAWVRRFPAAGIVAWQTLTITALLGVALSGLTLVLPLLPTDRVATIMRLTPLELEHHYATPGGGLLAAVTASVIGAALLLVTALTARDLHAAGRERRMHSARHLLVGVRHRDGYLVLEHDTPMVYCLPGRSSCIVVTSGAATLLSRRQLFLVLEHERVHLRVRHDVALTFASVLSRTFPWWGLLVAAHREIHVLAEMQADDIVQGSADRRELGRALALMRLGAAGRPSAVSAPLEPTSIRSPVTLRLERLTRAPGLHARAHATGTALAGLALLSTPVALALAPAVDAATTGCCVYADQGDRRSPVVPAPAGSTGTDYSSDTRLSSPSARD